MRPELVNHLRDAQDLYSLTKGVLGLCEPYGPVHSFKLVHNRGAARVVCFIELESPKPVSYTHLTLPTILLV